MARVEHVYLFDIDGTLVNAQGVGSRAFRRAVQDLLQHELDWHGRDFAGMPDAGLFERAITEARQAQSMQSLTQLYHDYLAEALAKQPALVLPGAQELIHSLAAQQNARVGLLTGNTRRGSELKLADLFTQFCFGFFGDEHTERTALGVAAREQISAEFGAGVAMTVIGDTPNDIACARAAGADCVAVVTGLYTAEELAAADRVLRDLTHW